MTDHHIRIEGHAGRITLNRPKALNALTYEMCFAIEEALLAWRRDAQVGLVMIDAAGEKAFCAGGDIAALYSCGSRGDYAYGQTFWRDEYRLNALIAEYPKPVVSFLQGFTMGGGVGIGCHGSHRIVGDSSRIAMPECGIGLVPDVGGSFLLARAPGRLGEYLGLTATRMGPGDALLAGFADHYLPEDGWETLKTGLAETGAADAVAKAALPAPAAALIPKQAQIDAYFSGETLSEVVNLLRAEDTAFASETLEQLGRNSPLSMACTLEILHRLRDGSPSIRKALELEYRFTHRAMAQGDLLEGIRAAIIDKDRNPAWPHALDGVPALAVSQMLMPVREARLTFHEED